LQASRNDGQRRRIVSHGADAFRYLSLAWREPIPDDEPQTLRDLIAEMCRPKTLDEHMADLEMAEAED
jgi:hypothetical protein